MKTKLLELCNPKDPHIISDLEKYYLSRGIIDQTSIDLVNKIYTTFVQRWDLSHILNTLDNNGDVMVTADDVEGLLE